MDPATIAMVAQVGMQLYSMSRSGGGGGVGKLLAAQTRMLAEISAQITVVNERLIVLYDQVARLSQAVDALPRQTALEGVRLSLGGLYIRAAEVLGSLAEYQSLQGRARAIRTVAPQISRILDELGDERAKLLADGSLALCPALAASWYIELQLSTNSADFDSVRLRQAASRYAPQFDTWLTRDIRPALARNNQAAQDMVAAITASAPYLNHTCNHSIGTRDHPYRTGGGGVNGDADTGYALSGSGTQSQFTAVAAPETERLNLLRGELDLLASAGVEVSPAYAKLAPQLWSRSDTPLAFGADRNRGRAGAVVAGWRQAECRDPKLLNNEFLTVENARGKQAEQLLMNTVLHSHFGLVCNDAHRSVRGVLDRLAAL